MLPHRSTADTAAQESTHEHAERPDSSDEEERGPAVTAGTEHSVTEGSETVELYLIASKKDTTIADVEEALRKMVASLSEVAVPAGQ